jgi:hypothetical protein
VNKSKTSGKKLPNTKDESYIWKQASKLFGLHAHSDSSQKTKRKPNRLKDLSGLGEALL